MQIEECPPGKGPLPWDRPLRAPATLPAHHGLDAITARRVPSSVSLDMGAYAGPCVFCTTPVWGLDICTPSSTLLEPWVAKV